MRLVIAQADYDAMLAHVQVLWPEEACGILAGQGAVVRQVYFVENIRHSPVAYEMDGPEQVRVMLEIETRNLELVGIFHSHPHGPPIPSATDIELAYYPEAVYVICVPDDQGTWQAHGFRIENSKVKRVSVEVES
jgi:proteasome lid subunit RPN8/RPN11